MARPSPAVVGSGFLVVVWLVGAVAAADDDKDAEFAFNLFSDVAPILALFGEQFARQFMSESLVWLDHLIFAMVPLGIVAAITGAIRVQGPSLAKAFIGRVRENTAQVEFELMSSTSHEVGEAFNGKGIVRVLGKPTVATFLLFGPEYEAAKTYFEKNPNSNEEKFKVCGIHSLQTVASPKFSLMSYEDYNSSTRGLVWSFFASLELPRRVSSARDLVESFLASVKFLLIMRFPSQFASDPPQDVEKGASQVTESTTTRMELNEPNERNREGQEPANEANSEETEDEWARKDIEDLGPPNLQLNLASDHVDTRHQSKHFELLAAAAFAVIIQAGLIVLAITTTSYAPLRDRIGSQPKAYGLPCYIAGSVLLSAGVGFCSFVVERKTKEVSWTLSQHATGEDGTIRTQCPQLMYVQKRQQVNDQAFDAYLLFAGPKNKVIASSRHGHSGKIELVWQGSTVVAAVSAGVGFTAQFMGLRGLTYPCSIAQVLAIICMTIIRAFIRRRLGHAPKSNRLSDEYELDHLATTIASAPDIENLHEPKNSDQGEQKDQGKNHFHWKIKLPKAKAAGASGGRSTGGQGAHGTVEHSSFGEQLLRVRERLEHLSPWSSKTSRHALALCRSIEAFMDTFFPNDHPEGATDDNGLIKWSFGIDATGENGNASIKITIRREKGKWLIEQGKVNAALSLWVASLETDFKMEEKRNESAKQFRMEGQGGSYWDDVEGTKFFHKHKFHRILGDDGGSHVLRRDLTWWTSYEALDINSVGNHNERAGSQLRERRRARSGGQGIAGSTLQRQESGKTQKDRDMLTIGFDRERSIETNNSLPKGGPSVELFVWGEGILPVILAQHLFTNFVWAISEHLSDTSLPLSFAEPAREVEIEGRDKFDPEHIKETWALPRLSHQKLSKLISQIENLELGNRDDILFCIVPAFSSYDLLPNRAMLQLIPLVPKDHAWTTATRQYRELLDRDMRIDAPEILCYCIIIQIMEFLYVAYQPYNDVFRPEETFNQELRGLVTTLRSPKFRHVVERVKPMHKKQGRQTSFDEIFDQYLEKDRDEATPDRVSESSHQRGCPLHALGHSELHQEPVSGLQVVPIPGLSDLNEALAPDIFGWTPIHYFCALNNLEVERALWGRENTTVKRRSMARNKLRKKMQTALHFIEDLPTPPDRLKRNHIHIAALTGNDIILASALRDANRDKLRVAISASGIDGMTPMHLAATDVICLRKIIEVQTRLSLQTNTRDIWGREPIHITTRNGHENATKAILETGQWSLAADHLGLTPIDYLLMARKDDELGDSNGAEAEHEETPFRPRVTDPKRLAILVEISLRLRTWQDDKGRTLLHHAIEATDQTTVETVAKHVDINLPDKSGQTPLHYALIHNRNDIAVHLINNCNANPSLATGKGETSLMLAAERNFHDVVTAILDSGDIARNAKDSEGSTALHYATNIRAAKKAQLTMFDQLEKAGCDIKLANSRGRTVIHDSLRNNIGPIWRYLLGLPSELWETTVAASTSPLIEAIKGGCPAEVVLKILQSWPDLINKTNSRCDQPAISFAIERDNVHIVKILAAIEEANLNQTTKGFFNNNDAPLHFAIDEKSLNSLAVLLQYSPSRVNIDITNRFRETPLQRAIILKVPQCVNMLVIYKLLSLPRQDRESCLEGLSKSMKKQFRDDFNEILEGFRKGPLTDEDLFSHLTKVTSTLQTSVALEIAMTTALERGAWQQILNPYHLAVQANSPLIVSQLQERRVDSTAKDSDGWTWEYMAIRHDRAHLLGGQANTVQVPKTSYRLLYDGGEDILFIGQCRGIGHHNCREVQDVSVHQASARHRRLCLRSEHPVSPSQRLHWFYFEVKVIRDSDSRILGLGFCRHDYPEDSMTGLRSGSWGYHGDDGGLFVEDDSTATFVAPNSEHGGQFGAGDVAGVFLDFKTGESFCTLNGQKLAFEGDSEQKIKERKFHIGKIYPCVGFSTEDDGVGLHFQVNFEGSPQHPFLYNGPEIRDEVEPDESNLSEQIDMGSDARSRGSGHSSEPELGSGD